MQKNLTLNVIPIVNVINFNANSEGNHPALNVMIIKAKCN